MRKDRIHLFEVTSMPLDATTATFDKECERAPAYAEVSLTTLLADPAAFKGKAVSVSGYYRLAEDESALYRTKTDLLIRHRAQAAWILGTYDPELAGRRVVVQGVVTIQDLGATHDWPLSLCGVWTIVAAQPQ
jgi:hypothetical protein